MPKTGKIRSDFRRGDRRGFIAGLAAGLYPERRPAGVVALPERAIAGLGRRTLGVASGLGWLGRK